MGASVPSGPASPSPAGPTVSGSRTPLLVVTATVQAGGRELRQPHHEGEHFVRVRACARVCVSTRACVYTCVCPEAETSAVQARGAVQRERGGQDGGRPEVISAPETGSGQIFFPGPGEPCAPRQKEMKVYCKQCSREPSVIVRYYHRDLLQGRRRGESWPGQRWSRLQGGRGATLPRSGSPKAHHPLGPRGWGRSSVRRFPGPWGWPSGASGPRAESRARACWAWAWPILCTDIILGFHVNTRPLQVAFRP